MERKDKQGERVRIELHRRRREILQKFREFAWDADEAGFRSYLSDGCGIEPGDPEYPEALREFWNLVRALESERRR